MRKEITKKDLQKIISVKKLPPNQKTEDPEHNIKLLSKANARLLICGNFEEFTVQGKKITGFTSLTISFLRLPVHPRNVPILLRDAISGRQLGWDSENTIDRNIVANNLSEIARYIVGLSLITDQRYEEAQGIFGPLYTEVNMKYNQRRISAEIKRFKDTIDRAYVMSLVCEINEKYCIELVNESLFQLKDTTINSWKVKIDKAVQIKADASALMMLAIFKFLSNDIVGSKEALHRARLESNTHGNLLCDLSEAFLLCFEGNLRDSKQLYKRVISSKSTPDLKAMNNIFSFLDQAISRYPEKPQIRFAYALLNDEFGDKNLASIEYAHFISETNGNNVFDRWSREAILRKQRIDTAKDIE